MLVLSVLDRVLGRSADAIMSESVTLLFHNIDEYILTLPSVHRVLQARLFPEQYCRALRHFQRHSRAAQRIHEECGHVL